MLVKERELQWHLDLTGVQVIAFLAATLSEYFNFLGWFRLSEVAVFWQCGYIFSPTGLARTVTIKIFKLDRFGFKFSVKCSFFAFAV